MAGLTNFTTGGDNAEMVVSLWTQQLLYEAKEKIFWDRFSGTEGENSPIIWKTDLQKNDGEIVKVDFVSALSGAGVTDTTALSGSEEESTFYQVDVTVSYLRNAVAVHKADQQKTKHQLMEWGRRLSSTWLAGKIDDNIFDTLDAVTAGRVYGGDATSKVTLDTPDVLTTTLISKTVAAAKAKYVQPLMVGGGQFYIMVVHPYAAYDLKTSSAWQEAQRGAGVRGLDNPIFSGALGLWDGVVLFENDRVESGSDGGGGAIDYSICHLAGANAAAFAWAMPPSMIEELTDYGARKGVGADAMFGSASATFNSVAIGHVPVMVAADNPNA